MPSQSDNRKQQENDARPPRIWTPLFVCILAVTLLMFMASQGLNAGGSVYLARLGNPAAFAGISAAVFSISAAIMRLVVGQLLDARGRYLIVVVGAIITAAATAACLPRLGNGLFLAMRVFQGIGFSMVTTTAATMASDVLPAERLGEGLGYHGLGQALAMSMGPALALFLVQTDPAENLFVAIAVLCCAVLVFALLCTYEKHPEKLPDSSGYRIRMRNAAKAKAEAAEVAKSSPESARTVESSHADAPVSQKPRVGIIERVFEPRALCGALPTLTIAPMMGFVIYFVGLYATQMDLIGGGVYYALAAAAMVAVRLMSRAFMDRVAPIRILGFGVSMGLISMGLLLPIQPLAADAAGSLAVDGDGGRTALFCVSGFLYGMCMGVCSPTNQSVAVKNTPPERWGAANALVLLAIDVGVGVASIAWGFVHDAWGFHAVIVACMVLLVIAFLFGWFLYPRKR